VLAHHLAQSAPLGNAEAAARYAVAAGDAAMARLAYETASRHYGQALELAPDVIDRVAVLLRRADADAATGRDAAAWAGYG
jgi:ABC-type phosphonate transport system ATPase subunit